MGVKRRFGQGELNNLRVVWKGNVMRGKMRKEKKWKRKVS